MLGADRADPNEVNVRRQSLNVLCEQERVRRLSERMSRDSTEASEPARERRAHLVSQEFKDNGLVGPGSLAASAPRFLAIEVLDAGLETKRRVSLRSEYAAPISAQVSATASAVPSVVVPAPHSRPSRSAMSAELLQVSIASEGPRGDPTTNLGEALDAITVKSIVGLRSVVDMPPDAEAVILSALKLLSSLDQPGSVSDLQGTCPPQTWAEAKRVFLKPGHFVNSLRRFPYAADRGQVPEADVGDVEEMLADVPPHGEGLEQTHPAVAQLYVWVRAALEYTAWSSTCLEQQANSASVAPVLPRRSSAASPMPASGTAAMPFTTKAMPSFNSFLNEGTESTAPGIQSRAPPFSAASVPVPASYPSSPPHARSPVSPPQSPGYPTSPTPAAASRPTTTAVARTPPVHGTSSPLRPATSAKSLSSQVSSPSTVCSTGRSKGSSTALARPNSAPRGIAVQGKIRSPVLNQNNGAATELADMKRKLEQVRREAREIKSLESQLRWDMQREEKRKVKEDKKEAEKEIMEWREDEAVGMKEYVVEKAKEQKVQDLQESKNFQEFKREVKEIKHEEELQRIREQLGEDMENSQWHAELSKAIAAERQEVAIENLDNIQDLREIRLMDKMKEQAQLEEERAFEMEAAMALEVQQMCAEKEELLKSLQHLRVRQQAPLKSIPSMSRTAPKRRALRGGS